jgi:HD-GYP domain-containing protein (c-di-GMP phosphodiesterase class II)
VADVAEAMASERAHRPAFALQDVIKELRRGAGVVYDARACEACERLVASGRFSFDKHRGLHARATLAKAARV